MLPSKLINFALISWCCISYMKFKGVLAANQPFFHDDVMVIEGHSSNSSEIKLILMANRNVSKIYIYLTHTFYADEDLQLTGIKELEIFANTWNITQPVIFDLSGSDGAYQVESASNGSAGKNGTPGMDAGNFFGLANKVINGGDLTVISNGGDGGYGQDGASSDDVYVLLNMDDDNGDSGWFSSGDLRNYYKKYFDDRGYDSEVVDIDEYTSLYAVFVHNKMASFIIRLHPQKCCGTTGLGGAGGQGGRYGKSNFKYLGMSDSYDKKKSSPTVFANDGHTGRSGKDGKPCENFALDVRVDTELRKVVFIVLPMHHTFSSNFTIVNHTKSTRCLPEYVDNNETVVIASSVSSKPNEIDALSSVNRYKQFLIENMKNSSLTSKVQETYEAINENWQLNTEYTLGGLVNTP